MKVFISWSGERSKQAAEVLRSWIRQVIQSAETWISVDIDKGLRWNEKVSGELENTKVGIICLNKENLRAEWILLEAGALSKTRDAYVCTFLLDINPADINPPLAQFQHTQFKKDDVRRLLHTINTAIIKSGEKSLLEKDLDEVFEVFWPRLE
ncbi:MAG TPA: TIR domain-containing protein, partial [Chitinophagaceae bacterium]|nr:TIR domain-containing protein [Chitinophagaceae bacterium]